MERLIKIGLAVVLLLCVLSMPYGYYQLTRYLALIGFSILAYSAKENGAETEMWIYVALALLFQPFFSIALGAGLWKVVDVIVGVGLLISSSKSK